MCHSTDCEEVYLASKFEAKYTSSDLTISKDWVQHFKRFLLDASHSTNKEDTYEMIKPGHDSLLVCLMIAEY